MGFFSLSKNCSICGKKVSLMRYGLKGKDACICFSCFSKCGFHATTPIFNYTADYCKALIEAIENGGSSFGGIVTFDDEKKQYYADGNTYNYADIVAFDLLEDQNSISSGGLGRALAGGVLFGGVGAIVGGVTGGKTAKGVCTTLVVKITVKNNETPTIYINFINKATKKDSSDYKNKFIAAQDCLAKLNLICNEKKEVAQITSTSAADEILKFKQLLDAGAITQDEFDQKKKQLLGL